MRLTVLIADPLLTNDAETICRTVRDAAPYCRIRVHAIDPANDFATDSAHHARAVAAALQSDVVLYLCSGTTSTRAALISLRERAGFTVRLAEPEFARAWFSENGRRSLYVLGQLPGALGSLALALEIGCADFNAAQRVRDGRARPLLAAV